MTREELFIEGILFLAKEYDVVVEIDYKEGTIKFLSVGTEDCVELANKVEELYMYIYEELV